MILSLEDVKKNYQQGDNKEIVVLNGLNLVVDRPKSIAILGKSGSGKSTFLSLVAGLDKPNSGQIKIDGKDIIPMSEEELSRYRAQKVGIIFQQFHLMSTLTALENVMLPLEILGESNIEQAAQKILDEVGLSHRANHFPAQLSGGEAQRVAIARALVTKPKILLADEPSGNLDDETGQKVMQLLFNLVSQSETTLILVTHDKELAQKCDKIFTLKDHKLYESN